MNVYEFTLVLDTEGNWVLDSDTSSGSSSGSGGSVRPSITAPPATSATASALGTSSRYAREDHTHKTGPHAGAHSFTGADPLDFTVARSGSDITISVAPTTNFGIDSDGQPYFNDDPAAIPASERAALDPYSLALVTY